MSIIKRKAGSEDIVKSVLEFDEVPTEGSHNLVESGAVANAIGNIGQPLQWKGPATVTQLNAGITGIQPGWTYTLTDTGTLTDGSVTVDVGDEVAWTEDEGWFKLGPENNIKIFKVNYSSDGYVWPSYQALLNCINGGTLPILQQVALGTNNLVYYKLSGFNRPTYGNSIVFTSQSTQLSITVLSINNQNIATVNTYYYLNGDTLASGYSSSSTYRKGDYCIYNGHLYRCSSDISTAESWNLSHWTKTKMVDQIGSVKNGGALTDAASVNVPNNALSTLSTAQTTLTLNVNVGSDEVPNFAVEITPSVDVTLTVTKTVGNTTTTLNPSVSGGNSLTTGKKYQVTCVGSCWTLAEFVEAIADKTLRFMFSNNSYDPTVAGVGSSGTWTKLGTTQTNVWDWTKNDTDFTEAFKNAFSDSSNLVSIIAAGDTSAVTNMYSMFQGCESLTSITLFDTSSVTTMYSMFRSCTSLTSVPLFDTSSVTNMCRMFCQCTSLTSIPLFNTSAATNMDDMFNGCYNVKSGALALYQQASTQSTPPTDHANTFKNCGRDTVTGAAELAQIPTSWGGTMEEV